MLLTLRAIPLFRPQASQCTSFLATSSRLSSMRRRPIRSASKTTAAPLPHLPDIEKLSPRVVRVLGGNPSKFTLQGTNTYLIGSGPKRMLIDTGEGNRIWPETLKQALEQEKVKIESVILTHWHPDHVGGVKDVKAVFPEVKIYKNQLRPGQGELDIRDGQKFSTEGATLRAFHSPGHTVDHMALILEEEDAMFTGDNVLGHGTAVFEDLSAYMNSLERMQHQFSGRAYPAHGAVIEDGKGKVQDYIQHRREREEQILSVLRDQAPYEKDGKTSMKMVKVIYKDYPENLHGPAEGGLLQVLNKLEGEGKVEKHGQLWKLVPKSAL